MQQCSGLPRALKRPLWRCCALSGGKPPKANWGPAFPPDPSGPTTYVLRAAYGTTEKPVADGRITALNFES